MEKLKNLLICLEGQDHCGKSTVAKLLVNKLSDNNIPAIYTFQPGDNDAEYNSMLSDMCKTKKYDLDPLSNLFAFLLDRSEHTSKKIIPALKEGKTVICDRWWYSTIAYQFYGKQLLEKYDLSVDFAYWMNRVASHNLKPHYAFFLKRPQKLIDQTPDNAQDLFETETQKFKERVKQGYEFLIQQGDLTPITVDPDPEVTLGFILDKIK